ncbi:MBOAT-2 domain-containing protein [Mycena indigotica]|uniref:MBOAT-2 domain-containing protein n=1 Tax=Mycena indigotica TaxID=2126181 RepID=A0A8H6W0Y6_9AGAR|nr:MBOAT-2 domain-containing protein [Mycena indigotica]KAF7299011.1 MBOAT-2 domain-containing protein [Mycena indigotica]
MAMLWKEVTVGSIRAFRVVIPRPQDRVPITWSTAPQLLSLYLPIVFLAFLARRKDTHAIRLLLLPTVITSALMSGFRFTANVPQLNVYDWGLALLAEVIIAKSLQYAFTKEGMLKLGEQRPGEQKGKEVANGHHERETRSPSIFPAWISDAAELIHTMRGPHWKFAQGTYIPPHTRPLERHAFLRATATSFLTNFLLLDLLESAIKIFPGVGETKGGSIFYAELPIVPRYVVSTTIHILTGSAMLAGFGMVYDLFTFVGVLIFNTPPSAWPPGIGDPWRASSLHELWSRQWQQWLRGTFLVYGGYPGRWIAGDLGFVFGTFLASGLYHELAAYALGRGIDHTVTFFFFLQGPLIVAERIWRIATGKRVGGRWGTLWVYLVIFGAGQMLVNSWMIRGFGGGMVIPPVLSPVRLSLAALGFGRRH